MPSPDKLNDDTPKWCPLLYSRFCVASITYIYAYIYIHIYIYIPIEYGAMDIDKDPGAAEDATTELWKDDEAGSVHNCLLIYRLLHQGKLDASPTLSQNPPPAIFPIDPLELFSLVHNKDDEHPHTGWHELRDRYTGTELLITEEHAEFICDIKDKDGSPICETRDTLIVQSIVKDVTMKVANDMRLIAAKT